MCKESLKAYEGTSDEVEYLKGMVMDMRMENERMRGDKAKMLEAGA